MRSEEDSTTRALNADADSVQISDEARDLQDRILQDRAERQRDAIEQLPPGRLREMLQRIMDRFYDRPDVRRTVLEKIAQELADTEGATTPENETEDAEASEADPAEAEAAEDETAGLEWMNPDAGEDSPPGTPAS